MTVEVSTASLSAQVSAQVSTPLPPRVYNYITISTSTDHVLVVAAGWDRLVQCRWKSAMPATTAAAARRRPFVGGNWKSNGSRAMLATMIPMLSGLDTSHTDVCVSPPSIYLHELQSKLANTGIIMAAQNVSATGEGAYTGEISASMLFDYGVRWTIIGHSERRQLYHTDNGTVSKQMEQALSSGMSIIVCIGETLAERKADDAWKVCQTQLAAASAVVKASDWSRLVISYEPVWAIGTGETATPQQAQEVHAQIRQWLADTVSPSVAEHTRIIYGGSVRGSNAHELIAQPDIDGFLVGGASIKPEFVDIVTSTIRSNSSS